MAFGGADRSVDLVVSVFGAMFAPRPLDVAKERSASRSPAAGS
jgi:hypothetical protein